MYDNIPTKIWPQRIDAGAIEHMAAHYLTALGITEQPKLHFVSLPGVKAAFVTERYDDRNAVYINSDFFNETDYEFTYATVLQELYRICVQNLTNRHCAECLRTEQNASLLQAADTEADVNVALYLQRQRYFPAFDHYMMMLHVRAFIHKDAHARYLSPFGLMGRLASLKQALDYERRIIYVTTYHGQNLIVQQINFATGQTRWSWPHLDKRTLEDWRHLYQYGATTPDGEYISKAERLTIDLIKKIAAT